MCLSVLTLHHPGHILANDGLPEHGPPKDVTDGAIRRLPHLLQLELCHGAQPAEGDTAHYLTACAGAVVPVDSPSTLFSSGVMVAHLIPTLYLAMASAHSTVTAPAEGGVEGGREEGRREEGRVGSDLTTATTIQWHRGTSPPAMLTSVVGLVPRLNAEVKALNVQLYKRQYQLVLDQLPDDPAGEWPWEGVCW